MSFNQQSWGRISGSANNSVVTLQNGTYVGAPNVFTYISSSDTIATIEAANYFAAVAPELNVNDLIFAAGSDATAFLTVSTVTILPPAVTVSTGVVTGDVQGPGSSTNNDFVLFNGATGKIIKDSGFSVIPTTVGGTNLTSYTLGDTLYSSATNVLSKLAGNITAVKQYLSQTGTGAVSAAPAWATIAGSDITGAALTKTDDTNVTVTLGGTPTTALLRAASMTLGWTGQLSGARGGTGVDNTGKTITLGGNLTTSGAFDSTFTMTGATNVTFPTSGTLATAGGSLVSFQVLTSGTGATYTKPAGVSSIFVECVGGGGGGGSSTTSTTTLAAGGGGGSGGYCHKFITSAASTYTYTIGAGGASASSGSATTFSGGTLSAGGGSPGANNTGAAGGGVSVGGAGGTSTGGDVNITGNAGGNGIAVANAGSVGGVGAASYFGGAPATNASNAVGTAAPANSGAGGCGSTNNGGNTTFAGGAGGSGIIIVWEFA